MRARRALLVLGIATAMSGASAALYKWVDEQGRIQYSDKPPPSTKSGVEMSRGGVITKKIEGSTAEQRKAQEEDLARRKAEELKAAEQRRQDIALVQSFTTEKEIEMKRDREIQALEVTISNMKGQAKSIDERLTEERKRAERATLSKKPLPDGAKEDIERLESEKKSFAKLINDKQQEVVATRQKYDELRRRFVDLKEQERNGTFSPVAAPTRAKK